MKFTRKNLILLLVVFLSYFAGEKKLAENIFQKITGADAKEMENFVTKDEKKINITEGKVFQVNKVVDGDTIHIKDENGNEDVVRFLAVNSSEMNATSSLEACFAREAKRYTESALSGKNIYLKLDETQPQRDKYGRLLAYVSTTSLFSFTLNQDLIQTGNAKTYRATPPAKKYFEYLELEKLAKSQQKGMWRSACN